jgi:hypothetical protein
MFKEFQGGESSNFQEEIFEEEFAQGRRQVVKNSSNL